VDTQGRTWAAILLDRPEPRGRVKSIAWEMDAEPQIGLQKAFRGPETS
jgi:hypothetical protein